MDRLLYYKRRSTIQLVLGPYSVIPSERGMITGKNIWDYRKWHPYFEYNKSDSQIAMAIRTDWVSHAWEIR